MKIKNILKNREGFTLIEMMVTMSVFLIVLSGVYMMVVQYGDVSRTEHSRLRMQQESRYLMSSFASEVRNAGSVLTISFTGSYLAGKDPYFSGIFPLNQTNYPDGIILASGDPEAVTRTSEAYSFANQGIVIPVEDTTVAAYDPSRPYEYREWSPNDTGIVLSDKGYIVFKVTDVSQKTITIRDEPVYYSGLLNTVASPYSGVSYSEEVEMDGTAIEYPKHAPVIRLNSFSIYLFKEVPHHTEEVSDRLVRQFTRVTDCLGNEDALSEGSDTIKSIISENIWDLQISYVGYEKFKDVAPDTPIELSHHFFAGGETSTSTENLLTDLKNRRIRQLNFVAISITDDYGGRGEFERRLMPGIGDEPPYYLPAGKFTYKIVSFSLEPKNYNTIFSK